jgi:ATP-dependent DNA helicase RecG
VSSRRSRPEEPGAASSKKVQAWAEGERGTPRRAPEERPITALRGVGSSLAERLKRLGVTRVQDLLFVLPRYYEDRTQIQPLGSLLRFEGRRVAVEGEVLLTEVAYQRGRQLLCRISDGSGFLMLKFFSSKTVDSIAFHQGRLARGTRVRCFGEVNRGRSGLEMIHPEYRPAQEAPAPLENTLTPIYPLTEGITQQKLRELVSRALEALGSAAVKDWLPLDALAPLALPSLQEALRLVHRPPRDTRTEDLAAGMHPAQRRLAFEELLAHHLSLKLMKRAASTEAAWPLADGEHLQGSFLDQLRFRLTGAQERAIREVERDLLQSVPMSRLLQGDVGCGKTVVAAAAAARAAGSGLQVAVMAPTELLAEQHWRSFEGWFRLLGVPVARLTSSEPSARRRGSIEGLAKGDIRIAVGTHALFQEGVQFAKLALVIVDEQHRFGVQQRLLLREKGQHQGRFPHQLIMTATPIPRTLAMTAYADLEISIIDELPPGRTPVNTVVMPEERRAQVVARVREACLHGKRAYWVCPLVDESEDAPSQAAEETHAALAEALPEVAVGLVHGRMPIRTKDETMRAFKAGKIRLLVATSVIEVGVDVPEATLMIIENAERMGLAQLHQLRGRVGRGSEESTCLLMYRRPLSELAHQRLRVIRETTDGFEIARQDLALRGPGEILGTRQTGLAQMKVADLIRDADLLPRVQETAELLLAAYPDNIAPLAARWIGSSERYARVG